MHASVFKYAGADVSVALKDVDAFKCTSTLLEFASYQLFAP